MKGVLLKSGRLFYCKNALAEALAYSEGRTLRDVNAVYNYVPRNRLRNSIQFSDNATRYPVDPKGLDVTGKDVLIHAKIYETDKALIFSSQNSGRSPNLEFAIVYMKDKESTKKTALRVMRETKEWLRGFCYRKKKGLQMEWIG